MVIMSKKNPDPGNSMHEEPVSFYNQYEKDVSMGLPSTQKSEEMCTINVCIRKLSCVLADIQNM
jgi:hypothetical protein